MCARHFQNGMHVMTGILIPYLAIFLSHNAEINQGFLKKYLFLRMPS